jgi:hypothetical protein
MKFVLGIWLALAAFLHAGRLEFESRLREVHASADAVTVIADFNFKNTSDKPVSIANTDSGCSCLGVEVSGGKLSYAPGESGLIRATFEVGNFSGIVDKVIALWLDKDPLDQPSQTLTVRVHVPVLVVLEPKTVRWDLNGKPEPQTIGIRMAEGETIRVLSVKSSSPGFSLDLKTLEEGRKYDLVVTPLAMTAPSLAVVRIETDCKIARHKTHQGFAVVAKPPAGQAETKKP